MAKAKVNKEGLAEAIASNLNKLFKDGQVAFVGEEETPSDLTDFVSTGCSILDLAVANRPHGGIAFGRITELNGLEGSGKSLLAAHLMANVQQLGGVAVLIDTETAMNNDFFDAVGVSRKDNWVYAFLDTVEDIFATVESIIETVRSSSKDRPVIIVIDSLAGASTKQEMASDFDKQGFATGKAILVSQALRKITSTIGKQKIALVITNQLRQKLNAPAFSDPYTTSGGKALAFHASTRIRLSQIGKIYKKAADAGEGESKSDKEVVGVKIKAQVTKNRLGPPLRSAEFDIYFDRGIDNYGSWLKFLRDKEVVEGRANALTYTDSTGTVHSFHERDWKSLLDGNQILREELYLKMCELCIMAYSTEGLTHEDVDVQQSTEDE